MPLNPINQSTKPFLHIVGGNLVQTVDKGTPGAKLREYELSNGTSGSKWELAYRSCSGHIQDIRFKDTDFGTICMIEFEDAIISLNTQSRYFKDFACKIVGADLNQVVLLHPYDIVDGEKHNTGVSVQVNGEKLKNHFYDFENKKSLYGYPEVNEEQQQKLKKNYWKVYFAEVEAFLIEQLEKLQIPRKANQVAEVMGGEVIDESLPF